MRRLAALAGWIFVMAAAQAAADPSFSATIPDAGARALALGRAQVAVADGALAAYWNPAGLAWLRGGEVLASHRALSAGRERQSGVLALRSRTRPALAFALQGELARQPGAPAREATLPGRPPETAYRATLQSATQLRPDLAFGAAIGRYADVADALGRDEGWVADAGLQWRRAGSSAGLAVRGARFGGSGGVSPVVSAGLGQLLADGRVVWSLQVDRTEAKDYRPAVGCEWVATDRIVLRAGGERPAHGAPAIGSCGFGLHHDRLQLDYACRIERDAPPEHVLSLGIILGALHDDADPAWQQREQAETPRPLPATGDGATPRPQAPVTPPSTSAVPSPTAPIAQPLAAPLVQPPAARLAQPPAAPLAQPPAAPLAQPPAAPLAQTPAARSAQPPTAPLAQPLAAPLANAPSAEQRPAASAPPVEDTAPHGVVVTAGPYPTLEAAAIDILRLRSIDLHPKVETRGGRFFIFVQRCATADEAARLRARAEGVSVPCRLESE